MAGYLIAVSAVAPSLLLVWYFHRRDAFPEPPRVLWTTFGLGVLVVFPVVLVALPADALAEVAGDYLVHGLLGAFLAAAIPEELGKAAVLLGYSTRQRDFNEPMDGIVYGVVASLGFATLENIFYVLEGGTSVAILRAFTAVPAHAFTGAIMGYYVGQARFQPQRRLSLTLQGVATAVLLHGLYDWPILTLKAMADGTAVLPAVDSDWVGLLAFVALGVLAVEWRWAMAVVRRARSEQVGAPPALPQTGQASTPGPAPRFVGVLMIAAGGVLAGIGGMVVLALLLAFALGAVEPQDHLNTLLGGVIIGVLPACSGAYLFDKGIRRVDASLPGRAVLGR